MGGATITQILTGSRQLMVTLDRDSSRLASAEVAIDATIATLDAKIIALQSEVDSNQSKLDDAKASLQDAIDNEYSRQVIVGLQQQVVFATNSLVDSKTKLSIAKYQLASATRQKKRLSDEINRSLSVTIATADSGSSFELGQHIGIAEYARQSNPGSFYVALPSERISVDPDWYLYDAARDGIALPQLSEQPYGWWYNTMVVPSAQIFRPRYVIGELLQKDDVANTGNVFVRSSADFKTRPVNPVRSFITNIVFDYETTNSKSFNTGDLVLLEYVDINTDPIIIGFGSDEILSTSAIAYHKDIVGFTFGRAASMLYEFSRIDDTITAEITPTMNVTSNGAAWTTEQNRAKLLEWGLPLILDFYGNRIVQEVEVRDTRTGFTGFLIYADEVDNTLVTWPVRPKQLFRDTEGLLPWAVDNLAVAMINPPPATPIPVDPTLNGGGHILKFIDNPINNKTSVMPLRWEAQFSDDNGNSEAVIEQAGIASINLATPTEVPVAGSPSNPNLYSKLLNLSAGAYTPADWLWGSENYVNPPAYNQFLGIRTAANYIEGFPPQFNGPSNSMFDIRPGMAYGAPADYSTYTPIAAAGDENYILYSEDLAAGEDSSFFGQLVLGDLISPTNAAPGEVYLFQSTTAPSPLIGMTYVATNEALPAGDYTFSAYIRRNSFCIFRVVLPGVGGVQVDLIDKTLSLDSGSISSNLEEIDEEWFRISIAFPVAVNNTDILRIRALSDVGADYNGLNGLNIWGLQINSGTVVKQYVKTTGTAIIP